MLIEVDSNQVEMEDRADPESRAWGASWREPVEAGACELLVTPVSKLPENAWIISYSN